MKNQREIPRNCDRGVPAKTKVHSPKAPTSSPKRPLAPSPQYPTPASHNKNRGNSVIIWPPLKCGKAVYSCPTSGQDPGWKSAHCAIFFSNGRFHWPGPLSRGGRGTGIAKKPPMRRPSAPKNQSHTHRWWSNGCCGVSVVVQWMKASGVVLQLVDLGCVRGS